MVPEGVRNEFDGLSPRIVGGYPAEISDFPHQLSLRVWGSHICGASILSERWAITAASCTNGESTSSLTVKAGSQYRTTGGIVYQVLAVIQHPGYQVQTFNYDAALLNVTAPFAISLNIRPITLASEIEGQFATVVGWGSTSSSSSALQLQLRQVDVQVLTQAVCKALYPGRISATMMCAGFLAGGKDSCTGDGGGPVVRIGKLVGIVSWGKGCAVPNSPGVYTRISVLRNWIRGTTGIL